MLHDARQELAVSTGERRAIARAGANLDQSEPPARCTPSAVTHRRSIARSLVSRGRQSPDAPVRSTPASDRHRTNGRQASPRRSCYPDMFRVFAVRVSVPAEPGSRKPLPGLDASGSSLAGDWPTRRPVVRDAPSGRHRRPAPGPPSGDQTRCTVTDPARRPPAVSVCSSRSTATGVYAPQARSRKVPTWPGAIADDVSHGAVGVTNSDASSLRSMAPIGSEKMMRPLVCRGGNRSTNEDVGGDAERPGGRRVVSLTGAVAVTLSALGVVALVAVLDERRAVAVGAGRHVVVDVLEPSRPRRPRRSSAAQRSCRCRPCRPSTGARWITIES